MLDFSILVKFYQTWFYTYDSVWITDIGCFVSIAPTCCRINSRVGEVFISPFYQSTLTIAQANHTQYQQYVLHIWEIQHITGIFILISNSVSLKKTLKYISFEFRGHLPLWRGWKTRMIMQNWQKSKVIKNVMNRQFTKETFGPQSGSEEIHFKWSEYLDNLC